MPEARNIQTFSDLYPNIKNFVFIGEAGSGKSEIAINLAISLAKQTEKCVHFFDLDMTKPLFRSRDQAAFLEQSGVCVHYEEQFYDAPTVAGGVTRLLNDDRAYTVLDVGGDYIGARSIGGYAPFLNRPNCAVCYVMNPYRPWSMDIEHIDKVLGETLDVSHVHLDKLHLVGNPNLGIETSADDVIQGARRLHEMVGPYKDVECFTVMESLVPSLGEEVPGALIPMKLYLTYEWEQNSTALMERF